MSEIIEIQIKSNIPQVEQETSGYRKQIRELRKDIDNLTPGTEQYDAALQNLANTMHEYQEEQLLVRNSAGDLGTSIENLQQLGTGIAAGFSSVNAIMALTGNNSEALQQTMVKLQAGIALVQGMKGLEGMGKTMKATINSLTSMFTATKAQTTATTGMAAANVTATATTKGLSVALKGLKAALIATGIGAIVVLVGELINGLGKLFSWVQKNVSAQNEFKDANENLNKSFDAQNEHLNNEIKLLSASGASQEEIIKEKQRLIAAQKAETEATLKNAIARLQSLKADSAWTRFWHGENRVIKELESETIPALEATLEGLEKQSTSLAYDYKAAEIKTQKDLEAKRTQAAEKAVQDAKSVAEQRKKFLDDVEKKAEDSFKKIYEEYKGLISSVRNTRDAILSSSTVSQAISAFGLVYGTDFNKLDKQLQGVQSALVSNAIAAAADERDKQLAEKLGDTEAQDKIKAEYEQFVTDIYNIIDNVPADLAPALTEGVDAIADKAKNISQEFTDRFNSLNSLYKDGIINYEEYYDTLTKIQNDYSTATDKFEEEYVSKVSGNESRVAELRYQYALKPLDFQKEVDEKFLNELDKQYKKIEANTQSEYDAHNLGVIANLMSFKTKFDSFYEDNFVTAYESETARLNFEKQTYDTEYQAKVQHIQDMLALNTLTVEQEAELNAQLDQLQAEKLEKDGEYYTNLTATRKEYMQSLNESVVQGINAMGDLSTNLANVFKTAAEDMKDAEGNYTEKGKNMLKASAALQIASATMTAAAGIATVWAQSATLGPIAGPIVAGIQTAAHLANLVVQIMTIKQSLAQGLAGNTGGSGASAAEAPDTSFTLQSTDAYQNTLSDETQSDLQTNAQANQRVYVVESDIQRAQDNTRTTVTTATF